LLTSSATLHLDEVLFQANLSELGGGGAFLGSSATDLYRVSFVDNATVAPDNLGGGAYVWSGSLTGQQVVFRGNESTSWGGGLRTWEASLELSYALFAGNVSSTTGAGLYASYGGPVTLTHTVFSGNDGSAVALSELPSTAPFTIDRSAFIDSTGWSTGGLRLDDSTGSITNSVFAGNEYLVTSYGAGGGAINETGSSATIDYCGFWENESPDVDGISVDWATNVAGDPGFIDVSSADPFDWDLHLDPASPLVDAANPSLLLRDPDNTIGDIGPFGGPGAGGWDLDWDGWYEWWHPGPYDPVNDPSAGWDCDDDDPGVFPGGGC
jgi:hypothetical protein